MLIPDLLNFKKILNIVKLVNINMPNIYNFGFTSNYSNRKFLEFINKDVLSKLPMTDNQLYELKNYLNWDIISNRYLSRIVLRLCYDKINWVIFLTNGKVKDLISLIDHKDKLYENQHIFLKPKIRYWYYTPNFTNAFPDLIDWKWYAKNIPDIPNYIMLKFFDKFGESLFKYQSVDSIVEKKLTLINWNYASQNKLSEKSIHLAKDQVNWLMICKYQKLSCNFMREHFNYLFIDQICKYQNLQDDFILEYSKKLNLIIVSRYQKLSYDFIVQNFGILSLENLEKNKHFNKKNTIQVFKRNEVYYVIRPTIVRNKEIVFCEERICL